MERRDLVSIIIPTLNGLKYLKQVMDSVQKHTKWPFEVIVIDNASKDGTQEYLLHQADYTMNGQYLRNEENVGFAASNNQGAEVAKGNFLCFLNNDTIVTKGWLTAMMNVFSEEKAVGMVGARLIHPGKGTVQHAGVVRLSSGMPDHIHFKRRAEDPLVMERKQYFAVTAACAIMPKQLFLELGGFDEKYWNGWEDMDLCQKIRRAGYRIYYEPTSFVYHYESRTEGRYAKEDSNFALYMNRWELGGKNGKK